MKTLGTMLLAAVGLVLASAHAEPPSVRTQAEEPDSKLEGADRGQEPGDQKRKNNSELRVGMLILREMLHSDDRQANAEAPTHRPFLIRESSKWPKQFPAAAGERTMKVEVVEVGKEPPSVKGYDLLVLMPCWAYVAEATAALDRHAKVFHEYVQQGGGLLVFQPNPMDNYPKEIEKDFTGPKWKQSGMCAPNLLPLPATFYNWYDRDDIVKRTEARHPITEGLADSQMPFPADRIVDLAKDYTVLARGTRSNSPSLAAGTFGKGRIVLVMSNVHGDSVSRQERNSDAVLRAILWTGGCGDKEVMAVGGR